MIRFPAVWCALLVILTVPAFGLDRKDVPYLEGGTKEQRLDFHVPDGPGPYAAVIMIHGGGFDGGDKGGNGVQPMLRTLSDAGFAWFSVNYRMAPKYHFFDANADVNAAILWVRENAARLHVDARRLVLSGESAGGFLAAYSATVNGKATRVAAVVDFYGPSDYKALAIARRDHPEKFDMKNIEGHMADGGGIRFFNVNEPDEMGLATLAAVSPINHLYRGLTPWLMIHGTADDQVLYEQSTAMCGAIRKHGGRCDLITIEGGRHGMGNWEKDPAMQHWKPEMVEWLKKALRLQ